MDLAAAGSASRNGGTSFQDDQDLYGLDALSDAHASYNMKRAMAIMGVSRLLKAMEA